MKAEILQALVAAKAARQPIAVLTTLATGQQVIVRRADATDPNLLSAFQFDRSGIMPGSESESFIRIYNPPLRLVIIGAVQIAQAVIPLAQACGYDVNVVDPRGAFATGARFPDINLSSQWPQEVMPQLALDSRTAVIALTHDPKIDDVALDLALKSEVFYIGALGSRKSHGKRLERLQARGFSPDQVAKIRGPIGLNIGAVGSAEIAISILAEITKALRMGLA